MNTDPWHPILTHPSNVSFFRGRDIENVYCPYHFSLDLRNDPDACYWVKDPAGGVLQIPSTGAGYRVVSEDSNFAGDMRESFNLRMPGADLSTELCGLGENKWPQPSSDTSKLWCERFERKSSEYFQVCFQACTRLRQSLADLKCLGPFLCSDSASDDAFTRSTSLLGFTHYNYNFRPGGYGSSGSEQVFGIRPHQDDGMCTLLYTDGQPGLEYAKGLRSEERSEAGDALGLFSGQRCAAAKALEGLASGTHWEAGSSHHAQRIPKVDGCV